MTPCSSFAKEIELSLIIPVYKGAAHLERALGEAVPYLTERFSEAFEIIPVLDGVFDDSDVVAYGWAARHPAVRPLIRPHRGKGAAVAAGVMAARGKVIFFTDVDLATPLTEIPGAVATLAEADMVIGSRRCPGARLDREQAPHRQVAGAAFRLMVRVLTGLGYADTQCGFKGFHREVAAGLFRDLTTDGFAFDVEVLLRARHMGLQVREYPVTWHDQPGSTVRVIRDSVRMARELVRLGRNEPVQEFARFVLVGAGNTLVDLAALQILMGALKSPGGAGLVLANSLAFSLAVMNSYYWNSKWTFARRGSFLGFLVTAVIGLQINNVIVLELSRAGLMLPLAKVGATVATVGWNYLAARRWVFRSRSTADASPSSP